MQERPQNFNAAEDESEATLVAPRFDAEEARRAHTVVPLEETPRRAPFVNARASPRRGLRRSWPPALVAVALLAAAVAGGVVASKFLGPTQSAPAAAQAPDADAAPQAAEAPTEAQAQTDAATPRVEERANRQPPRPRAVPAPEEEERVAAVTAATRRVRADDYEDEDKGRRGKSRGKRRGRDEDEGEGEKEVRKALKRAGEKVPRLVDVLVRP